MCFRAFNLPLICTKIHQNLSNLSVNQMPFHDIFLIWRLHDMLNLEKDMNTRKINKITQKEKKIR